MFHSLYNIVVRKGAEHISNDLYLEQLINQYGDLVFSICYNITKSYFDAQDLSQDTFVSIYNNLDSFDKSHEKAWISKIATNKCLDFLKSAKRRQLPTEDTFFISEQSNTQSPEDFVLEKEINEQLFAICNNLKHPYKDVAVAYFCKDEPIKEISRKTGKNIKTLQTQIYRAKEMIRTHLRKECPP